MDFQVEPLCTEYRNGNTDAVADVWPEVYEELRRMARSHLRLQRGSATLDTVGLVNDAYLRLQQSPARVAGRAQFLALSSTIMRALVVDTIRHKARLKRGGNLQRVTLATATPAPESSEAVELLDLDSALVRLGEAAPRLVHLVEMKFFGGLTNEEIATALGISVATVKREWLKARTLLHELLSNGRSE